MRKRPPGDGGRFFCPFHTKTPRKRFRGVCFSFHSAFQPFCSVHWFSPFSGLFEDEHIFSDVKDQDLLFAFCPVICIHDSVHWNSPSGHANFCSINTAVWNFIYFACSFTSDCVHRNSPFCRRKLFLPQENRFFTSVHWRIPFGHREAFLFRSSSRRHNLLRSETIAHRASHSVHWISPCCFRNQFRRLKYFLHFEIYLNQVSSYFLKTLQHNCGVFHSLSDSIRPISRSQIVQISFLHSYHRVSPSLTIRTLDILFTFQLAAKPLVCRRSSFLSEF